MVFKAWVSLLTAAGPPTESHYFKILDNKPQDSSFILDLEVVKNGK